MLLTAANVPNDADNASNTKSTVGQSGFAAPETGKEVEKNQNRAKSNIKETENNLKRAGPAHQSGFSGSFAPAKEKTNARKKEKFIFWLRLC